MAEQLSDLRRAAQCICKANRYDPDTGMKLSVASFQLHLILLHDNQLHARNPWECKASVKSRPQT